MTDTSSLGYAPEFMTRSGAMTFIVQIVDGSTHEAMLITDAMESRADHKAGRQDTVKSIRINDSLAAGACGHAFYANMTLAHVVNWKLDEDSDRLRILNEIEATGHDRPHMTYQEAKDLINKHMGMMAAVSEMSGGLDPTMIFLVGQDDDELKMCAWEPANGYQPAERVGHESYPEAIANLPIPGITDEFKQETYQLLLEPHSSLNRKLRTVFKRCVKAGGEMSEHGHVRRLSNGFKLEPAYVE